VCDRVIDADNDEHDNADIFGQPIKGSSTPNLDKLAFACINCKRQVMPSRYAPHLEKVWLHHVEWRSV